MTVERVAPFSAPVARLTLALATALTSLSMPIWRVASAAGSAWMRTAYFAEPNTPTCATPSMVESCRASKVSAYSSTSDGFSVVGTHRQEHDRDVGRVLFAEGGRLGQRLGQVAGGGRDRRLHVLRRAVQAAVQAELQLIWVWPWVLVDVIWSMPVMVENWFSSGAATEDAMVSGSAPGRLAITEMVGKSMLGRSETGRLA